MTPEAAYHHRREAFASGLSGVRRMKPTTESVCADLLALVNSSTPEEIVGLLNGLAMMRGVEFAGKETTYMAIFKAMTERLYLKVLKQ